ncbi:Hsp33 family molecular chaperone HslO [Lacimicrobium alkaliphilum]|uniref:33 kDa chaperonin n=1 Tax=Lacimicrobium alkaliphilum TaxID=1526571 RepID=A0A0U2ZC14_9ALTE|nr:Hsp33 family molecular chaperone HslO [Lacimicrobium alkaliphilum]ALT00053.1 molecular chaperone Hsp33 [Lacimicrobium alkaliphilum]
MNQASDQLFRYLFSNDNVRGELVQLQQSYAKVLDNQQYPQPVQRLLGELMAATSLLTATLKFEGDIAVQVQSDGPVKYAVINGTHKQELRGVARWDGDVPDEFSAMFNKGVLAITITPSEGERYQGLVELDKPSLAECLERYFEQSEQLLTRVILKADTQKPQAAGMLLQVLPGNDPKQESFNHLVHLTDTITADELFTLPAEQILHRLYHEQKVEVYPPQPVIFKCSCSKQRSATALASVDKQNLLDIVAEDGFVSLNCQYCHAEYRFDAIDIEAIHSGHYGESQQLS